MVVAKGVRILNAATDTIAHVIYMAEEVEEVVVEEVEAVGVAAEPELVERHRREEVEGEEAGEAEEKE